LSGFGNLRRWKPFNSFLCTGEEVESGEGLDLVCCLRRSLLCRVYCSRDD